MKQIKAMARRLLDMHSNPDPDPDKACAEFERLALELARLCAAHGLKGA